MRYAHFALLVAGIGFSGLPAYAQSGAPQPIGIGDTARGALDRPNPGTNPAPAVACYSIEVPPETDLAITLTSSAFRPEIWFARGALCSSPAVQDRAAARDGDHRNARLRVTTRGGRYLIMVRGTSPEATGLYTLTVDDVPQPEILAARDRDQLPGGGNSRPPAPAPGQPAPERTATLANLRMELNEATGGPEGIEADRIRLMNMQQGQREEQIRAEERRRAEEERRRREAELERQRQLAIQRQQEEESGGNGGLFGALIGGSVAALAGGDAGQIMEGASYMANVVDPTSTVAQSLSTVSSTLASESGSSGFGTALAPAIGSAGTGGVASYPTQPNALDGEPACSGFTLGNYQQRGLGGGDPQMDSQCANAMALYAQYLNAIRMGYSEADSMRTYNAHQQAAQVAIQFYNETR